MGEADRKRHELGCLPDRVAEHEALISRAGAIDPQRDVLRLLVDAGQPGAGLVVESVRRIVVADIPDRVPHDPRDVHVALGRDLTRHEREPRRHQRLAGNTTGWVLRQDRVQDGVRNLIRDLVGMPFRHGLGSKRHPSLRRRAPFRFRFGLHQGNGHEDSTSDEPTFRRWYAPRTTAFSPTTEASSTMSSTIAPSFTIEFRTTAWRTWARGPIETCGPMTAAVTSAVGSKATGGITTTPSRLTGVASCSSRARLVSRRVSTLPQSYQPDTGKRRSSSPRCRSSWSASVSCSSPRVSLRPRTRVSRDSKRSGQLEMSYSPTSARPKPAPSS